MNRQRFTLGLRAAVAAALALAVGLLGSSQVSAQDEALTIGRITAATGQEVSLALQAVDIGAPGLGAWEIEVVYEPAVLSAVDCEPEAGSVCNIAFGPDRVRIAGASASGHEGDTVLAALTFRCEQAGISFLALGVAIFADASVGAPQPIDADVRNGSVACSEPEGPRPAPITRPRPTPEEEEEADEEEEEEEEVAPTATPGVTVLPRTGAGGPADGGGLGWLAAALAGAGLAAMAGGYGALRLRPRRAPGSRLRPR